MSVFECLSDLLVSLKKGKIYDLQLAILEAFTLDDLINQLPNDDLKKTFWINVYNAFIQIKGTANLTLLQLKRTEFFSQKWIRLAGELFSFDDIEHGILRKGTHKYSLGFLKNIFGNDMHKKLMVNEIDYRIHFALNCGAASCPAIIFYSPGQINEQLDEATKAFLSYDSIFDERKNVLHISKLMHWYIGDFGGRKGVRAMLKSYDLLPSDKTKIKFKKYDWSLKLRHFK